MPRLRKRHLSHGRLLTADFGKIYPVLVMEVLPGDVIRHRVRMLMRLSALHKPVMHQVRIRFHTFYCPYRLVWDEWEDFAVGVPDNKQQTRTVPQVTCDGGELCDHMGIPPGYTGQVDAYAFRAYRLIHNEWYRDQELQPELDPNDGSVGILNCAWEKDYFTSARPNPQKGPDITIPIAGGGVPIEGIGIRSGDTTLTNLNVRQTGKSAPNNFSTGWVSYNTSPTNAYYIEEDPNNLGYPNVRLSADAGIDVTDLRRGIALQRIAEARMRYGSRYNEMLRYWGINPSDGRLQIPELLARGSGTVAFSEVLDTAGAASGHNVGDQFGHGISAVRTRPYRKVFEEHGVLMTLMSVIPRTSYVQGLPRMFQRKDRDDYFHPELMGIGDQPVYTRELFSAATADKIFGFQERYREFRDFPSTVHGRFRTGEDMNWHMARSFSTEPVLNASFVSAQPTNRIFADTTQAQMLCNLENDIMARRLV